MGNRNLLRKVDENHPIYHSGAFVTTQARQRPVKNAPNVEEPGDTKTGGEGDGLPTSQDASSPEPEPKADV